MDSASIAIIASWSRTYGVPAWIPLCIAYAETSITPSEIGDNGTSYGLFQLHTPGGQGDVWTQYGSSPSVLLSANLNAEIGVKPIAAAYRQGEAQGLNGFPLLQYTADHSGHPDDTGYMPSYYLSRLQLAWTVAQQQNWLSLSSSASGQSASSSSGGTPSPPSCAQYGTYVGEGTAAAVRSGLYVFERTLNGITTKTAVTQSCGYVDQWTHGQPVPATIQPSSVNTTVHNFVTTISKPQNALLIMAGLAVGAVGFYVIDKKIKGQALLPVRITDF